MARKYSQNLSLIRVKALPKVRGRAKPTMNVFVMDALATSEPIAEPRHALMEDVRNLRPAEKALEIVRKKSKNLRKMCHWTLLICGLMKCCQTTAGETMEEDVAVDES